MMPKITRKDDTFAVTKLVFGRHGGVLRASEAIGLGIHPRTLYAIAPPATHFQTHLFKRILTIKYLSNKVVLNTTCKGILMKTVTAADANRQFSSVLRDVSQGEIFTVVSRGRPVATISPAKSAEAQRSASKTALIVRLRKQEACGERNWTRDELYDRGL